MNLVRMDRLRLHDRPDPQPGGNVTKDQVSGRQIPNLEARCRSISAQIGSAAAVAVSIPSTPGDKLRGQRDVGGACPNFDIEPWTQPGASSPV
jgi:hypothetical protein